MLTRSEERALFLLVQRVQHACPEFLTGPDASVLPAVAVREGISLRHAHVAVEQARRAHVLLVQYNLPLVLSVAARYGRGKGTDLRELVSEGTDGIRRAIERFDLSRHVKFSTYAMWYLRAGFIEHVRRQRSSLHVPSSMHTRLAKVLRAQEEIVVERGSSRSSSVEAADIAARLGLSVEQVNDAFSAHRREHSLENPSRSNRNASFDEDLTLDERLSSGEESACEAALDRQDAEHIVQDSLAAVLQTLEPRERNVVRLRYGLNREERVVPRKEIGAAYGLSAERVRQIELVALEKLNKPWRQQFLLSTTEAALTVLAG